MFSHHSHIQAGHFAGMIAEATSMMRNCTEASFFGVRCHSADPTWDLQDQYCGVDRQPQLGTACEGGPAEVRVCGMRGGLVCRCAQQYADNAKSKILVVLSMEVKLCMHL